MGHTELYARPLRDWMCLTLATIHFLEGKLRLREPSMKRTILSLSGSSAGLLPPESPRLERDIREQLREGLTPGATGRNFWPMLTSHPGAETR